MERMRTAVTGLGIGLFAVGASACWIVAGVDDLPDRSATGTGASGTGGAAHGGGGSGADAGGGGNGGAAECGSPADCMPPGSICTVATCEGGVCGAAQAPQGTACEGTHVCDESGACVECIDGTSCRSGACDAKVCVLGVDWAKRYGGDADDIANGVAIDSNGNVAVVGKMSKDVDFIVTTLSDTEGLGDGFVLGLSDAGVETAALRVGGAGLQQMTSAAYDGSHLYVGGEYTAIIDSIAATTPPTVLSNAGSQGNGAILRIDGSTVTWWREFSETGANGLHPQSVTAVATTPGFVHTAVRFEDVLNDPAGVSAATPDALLTQFSGAGVIVDYTHLFGSGDQMPTCIAVDSNGAQLMGGFTDGDFVLDPLLTKVGSVDGWVYSDGTVPWIRGFGAPGANVSVTSIAVGPADVVFVAGSYDTGVDLGDGTGVQPAVTNTDVFLVAIDPSGAVLWGKVFPTTSDREARVAIDDAGNLVFVTVTSTAVDFGGGLVSATGASLVAVKFDPNGAHLWSGRLGGFATTFLTSIAVVGPRLVVGGRAFGDGDLGTGALHNPADLQGDIFVASYRLP